MGFTKVFYVSILCARILAVDSKISFKTRLSKDDTRNVSIVMTDWMYVYHNLDGLRTFEFAKEPADKYLKFYQRFYHPLVSKLKKDQDNAFQVSLRAFQRKDFVVLADGARPRMEEINQMLDFYKFQHNDWLYVSQWLEEYGNQAGNKTSTLVFFCKGLMPLILDTLNCIQEKTNVSVIVVSNGDNKSGDQETELPMLLMSPFYDCSDPDNNNNINKTLGRSFDRECRFTMPIRIDPVVNAIKNPQYRYSTFIRYTRLPLALNMSCLQNKTISIIFKEWDIDATIFSFFLTRLEHLVKSVNPSVQIQYLAYREPLLPFRISAFYKRLLRFSLANNDFKLVYFKDVYGTLYASPRNVFDDPEKNKIFLHTIRSDTYRGFIKHNLQVGQKKHVLLEHNNKQYRLPFRQTAAENNDPNSVVIKLNQKNLDSDILLELLMQAFVDLAC